MRALAAIALALGLIVSFHWKESLAQQPRGQETASLHVVLLDGHGDDISQEGVKSFSLKDENGKEFANQFHGNTATQVPYGTYTFSVKGAAFHSTSRSVDVVQPDVWVVVGLDFGLRGDAVDISGVTDRIVGTLRNVNSTDEPVYVRLIGAYSNYLADSKVIMSGGEGTFTLSGVFPFDRYVLITTGRNGVLDARPVHIESGKLNRLLIDLGKRSNGPSGLR